MSKLTKKQQKINELLEGFVQPATAKDALAKLQEISKAVSKFDETVECHMRLGIDVKQADQQVRSTTVLPAGLGKEVRVCVIAKGAKATEAKEAGAAAIVVSNHGGRVLNDTPATADVLEDIVKAVDGRMKIFVDGGIRTGTDVFKALALGADAVIIARPFVVSVYGGAAEGVDAYVAKLYGELEDAMTMCGAHTLAEITRDMVTVK